LPENDPRGLYGLPLERFVPERTALAKALRTEGDRQRAAEVATLRKPSVAAWAVNQLVRTQRREVAELFDAGDQLQKAQSDVIAGRGGARALRAAADREREAAERLSQTARGLLSSHGHELSPVTIDRVHETLHAAALDSDARDKVRDGCLERELRHVGLGAIGDGAHTKRRATKRGTKAPAPDAGASGAGQEAERERAAASRAARKAAAEARRAAERASRELHTAQQRRDRAAAALDEAEAALGEARERAEEAALAHARTQQALDAT
jgi:hypothetical protein